MKKLTLIGALFASLILVGCGTAQPTPANNVNTQPAVEKEAVADSSPIKLGVITPLSGPAAGYGQDVMHGYTYAAEKINAEGGINGREVKLIVEDGKCTGKDATSAAQKLLNVDGVTAILGGTCSSETIPAGKLAQQLGVPMVSATASSPEISSLGDYVYRYWNDADAGVVMLDYFSSISAEGIALIYEGTDYAAAYANVVREGFDGDIIVEEKFLSDEKDFTILAKKITENNDDLDAVVFIPQTETTALAFIKAIQSEGNWDVIKEKMIGTEVLMSETVGSELGEDANGLKGVTFPELTAFGDTAERAAELLEGYEAATAAIFAILAADSLELVTEAIAEVGTEGSAIKGHIAAITEENPRSGYIDFYFNEDGDGQGMPFTLVELQNGAPVSVN